MKKVISGRAVFAFSLIELMISLIVISCITAAFIPVITKKLKSSEVSVTLAKSNEITTECEENFSNSCKLCTDSYCIDCELNSCPENQYIDSSRCSCVSCKEKFGELCSSCNKNSCTKCISGTYYIKDGVCTPCPSGSYCDGKDIYATCPGEGYYCDSSGVKRCSDVFSSFCTACNASGCTKCSIYYFVSQGTCKRCGSCCSRCRDENYCTACNSECVMDSSHKCSKSCPNLIPGCYYCSSETVCTMCAGGYFLNSAKTCTKCEIENCAACKDGQGAQNPLCEECKGGYYLSGGKCSSCSTKYGANCVACDAAVCKSCAQGYYLSEDKKSCLDTDNKFNCSDSNFMQIGNLCVTRKNMGDSNFLSIPDTVLVAQAGVESCYSLNSKCCWKGETTAYCDSGSSGYSGCTRTVCDWEAANEICSKFKYGGKTWRLPKSEEMADWGYLSVGLGANGLMLCDTTSGYLSAQCRYDTKCKGQQTGNCEPRMVWTSTKGLRYYLSAGIWIGGGYSSAVTPFSVRCVTEME